MPYDNDYYEYAGSAEQQHLEPRKPKPLTISELNLAVQQLLLSSFGSLWITGEVGNMTISRNGHVYLTLKDDHSQLKCTFFNAARLVRDMNLREGAEIEAWGVPTMYTERGDYQFNIKRMELCGVGDLSRRFEELKKKLQAEGLFDQDHKKPIPSFPRRIGLITSSSGAAVKDFLRVSHLRFPGLNVRIFPSPVQGKGAEIRLAEGVRFFNASRDVDVIVLTRGGGSLEDLWPFNEEILARAIYDSRIPVVSAVGHEVDYSISDFVADLRVATPSAAAEKLTPELHILKDRVSSLDNRLLSSVNYAHSNALLRFNRIMNSNVFRRSSELVQSRMQKIDLSMRDAENALARAVDLAEHRKQRCDDFLKAFDPFRVLQRGYAFILNPDDNHQYNSVAELQPGTTIRAVMADGFADMTVNGTQGVPLRPDGTADLLGALCKNIKP